MEKCKCDWVNTDGTTQPALWRTDVTGAKSYEGRSFLPTAVCSAFPLSVLRNIQLGSEGTPRQSHGLWGEQDRRSGASLPGELDQRDRVDLADQHGRWHPPVVHPEHPLRELWGQLHFWENNQSCSRFLWGRPPSSCSGVPEGLLSCVWSQSERRETQQPPCDTRLPTPGGGVSLIWHHSAAQERPTHWGDYKMAGQSDVHQAGDHHSDTEHPSGGQERKGEEVPHHLRGYETRGDPQTGGRTKHLNTTEMGRSQRKMTTTVKYMNRRWRKVKGLMAESTKRTCDFALRRQTVQV